MMLSDLAVGEHAIINSFGWANGKIAYVQPNGQISIFDTDRTYQFDIRWSVEDIRNTQITLFKDASSYD